MILSYLEYTAEYSWIPILGQFVAELHDASHVVSFSAASMVDLQRLMIDVVHEYQVVEKTSLAVTALS